MATFGASIPISVPLNPLFDLAKSDADVQGYQIGQQKIQGGAQELQNAADIRALGPQIAAGDESAIRQAAAIDPKQGYYLAHAAQALSKAAPQDNTIFFGDASQAPGGNSISGVGRSGVATASAGGDGIIDALGRGESPGPGVVNAQGYSGQFQFGKARLADLGMYKPAQGENLNDNHRWAGTFAIPGADGVKSYGDFLNDGTAQRAAMHVHVGNIQQAIAQTPGADQLNPDGLVAVAHLGGVAGMRKFIESGGKYDPADANGTHLSDYYKRYSQVGRAQLAADHGHPDGPMPPPGQDVQQASAMPAAPVQVASLDPSAGVAQAAPMPGQNALMPAAGAPVSGARNALMDGLFPAGLPGVTADPSAPQAAPQPSVPQPNALLLAATGQAQGRQALKPQIGYHKDGSLFTEGAPAGYVNAMVDNGEGRLVRGFTPAPGTAAAQAAAAGVGPKLTAHWDKDNSGYNVLDENQNFVRHVDVAPKKPDDGVPTLTGNGDKPQAQNMIRKLGPKVVDGTATPAEVEAYRMNVDVWTNETTNPVTGASVPGYPTTPEMQRALKALALRDGLNGSSRPDATPDAPGTMAVPAYTQAMPTGSTRTVTPPRTTPEAINAARKFDSEAGKVQDAMDQFRTVMKQDPSALSVYLNNPRDPKAVALNTAYSSLATALRGEAFLNTGVLQPHEQTMLNETLLNPQSLRGAMTSPEAREALFGQLQTTINNARNRSRAQAALPALPAPGGPKQQTDAPPPPSAAIQHLQQNPDLAAAFDQKYGAGAAQRALGR